VLRRRQLVWAACGCWLLLLLLLALYAIAQRRIHGRVMVRAKLPVLPVFVCGR
jgi:hypothetical protein